MANTIDWGKASVNNTIDYGQGAIDNTINWGKSQTLSPSGETNITGTPSTPSFQNLNSFSFDGVDDYFIGTSTYSELDGQNKLTLSVWIKPISGAPLLEYIISNPRNTTANQHQFALTLYENFNVQLDVQGHNSQYVIGDINAITYGAWNHILACVDLDRTTGTEGAIFINGVDETTTSAMGTLSSFYTATDALHIGIDANGGYNRYNGLLDEVAIWSGTDQRANVSEIYGGGQAVDLNNLATAPQPTTWQRMGDNATWNGATWTMTDVNGGYTNRSINMLEANRTTDVPTASTFTNTQSIALDGVDDFVAISANSNLQISDTFTISQWVKFTSTSQMYVANFGNDYGTYVSNGKFGIVFRNTANTQKGLNSTVNINDGNWHHVLAIKTTTNIYLYVDGVLESNSQGDVGRISTRSAAIGALFNGSLLYNGNIDEVAIWNSDQSANASTIYNGGVPNDISSLNPLSWWRCGDGDTAPTLTDNGSGSNDGTMTNFSTFSTDVPT